MMIKLTGVKPVPSKNDIADVELSLGYRFPKTFLATLPKINGAKPAINEFDVPGEQSQSGVTEFLEFSRIPEAAKISGFSNLGNIFPIALTEGGDKICISAEQEDAGAVFFWNHERVQQRDDLILIAKSLELFLNLLRPIDASEINLVPGQVKKAWINPEFLRKK
jgi:hypothetical protein